MLNETQIQDVITKILKREGGDSNDSNDLGGETHFGITIPFASTWGIPWPPTQQEAREGYRRMLAGTRLDQIPDAAALDLVADSAVNHGEGRAIKWLQAALEITADGVIGSNTVEVMLFETMWVVVYGRILKQRGKFYAEILHNEMVIHPERMLKDSQVKFVGGWYNRLFSFL